MQKSGFDLIEERELSEIGGTARLWKHIKTGAQLLSVINKDENKCFGVNFYTPPTDSTGVAHIIEHSVLCGSEKYPVKEPFVELLKGSLQTFLNAFTFPDKTCYPVASANLQDFYNLIDVYLDAVFHPRLAKATFEQEGWHVEAEDADTPWTFKGVVYNEMKGVYSSPDSILAEQSQQAVFPDNLYKLDSGGNPEHIPDLTYEAFCDFHHRYYQPGNAMFFFWGDDPEERRLERIAAEIENYEPVFDLPEIKLQAIPSKSRYVEIPYAASENDERAFFTVNWLLPERGNITEALKLEILQHILEGLPGSPLRRALMESGLGEDTTGGGLETNLRQMYYSTGLKGIAPADTGQVEELLVSTLTRLVAEGIDANAIEAAVNSVEFALREDNAGRFPRGLTAMLMALSTWNYGGNPISSLQWEEPLAEIKTALASGEKVFEKAIQEYFLNNPHICVSLLPDKNLAQARQAAEHARINQIQEQAGPDQRQKMVEATQKLTEAQLTPDKPEDLAKIPALGIKDLPLENAIIPTELTDDGKLECITHALPTRGVAYAHLLLPIPAMDPELLPLLPLFCRSLIECGSAHADYSELGMKIASKTGGMGVSVLTGTHVGTRETFAYLDVGGKTIYDKIPAFFDLMQEILLTPQTNPDILRERLELMLLEERARLEHGLQAAGHAAVSVRLGAHFTGEGAFNEAMSGFTQLQSLHSSIDKIKKDPDALLQDMSLLRQQLICGQKAIFSAVAEEKITGDLKNRASALLAQLPDTRPANKYQSLKTWPPMSNLPRGEAFITQGQVNYVGKGANAYDLGYKYNGAVNVIMRWLRMGRLWEKVRVAGGAYGAFCSLDRITGNLICTSYRDPNIDATLSAYNGLAAYIRSNPPTPSQLTQAIIGAVGAIDTYLLPDAKGAQALAWHLTGLTPEMRQKSREEMLHATEQDFEDFANTMEAFAQMGDICVIGGEKAKETAKQHDWKDYKII